MGQSSIDPKQSTGTYIEPELWNELVEDKDTIIDATRNEYEIGIGTFKNLLILTYKKFQRFSNFFANEKIKIQKNTKIAMFCTGVFAAKKFMRYLQNKKDLIESLSFKGI